MSTKPPGDDLPEQPPPRLGVCVPVTVRPKVRLGEFLVSAHVAEAVRKAVAAERERCAKIVEAMGNERDALALDSGRLIDSDEAAERIRSGEQP